MRAVSLVQELHCDVAEHWRRFLDGAFERAMYLEGMGFQGYEQLERVETEAAVTRRCRMTPRLDPIVARALPGFAYLDDGTFDKATQVWRSRATPSLYADRLSLGAVVSAEPAGAGRCRRRIELTVEVRAPGIASLVENALAKSLRKGWEQAARYLDAHAAP